MLCPSTLFILIGVVLPTVVSTKCNFNVFPTGCEDETGSFCNETTKECGCKDGFVVKVHDFCLPMRNITESCVVSAQCVQLPRAKIGCYLPDDQELVEVTRTVVRSRDLHWLKGRCSCQPGYYLNSIEECVSKRIFNSHCTSSLECLTTNSYCDHFIQRCRCKPKFRYSSKRNRCVAQLVGESCTTNEHCQVYDSNAECKIGGCQCKSGFVLSNNAKCVQIVTRGASHNVLMVIVIIGTALVFALLSTVHKKWTAPDLFGQNINNLNRADRIIPSRSRNCCSRTRHPRTGNIQLPSNHNPVPLSVPALAVIWPLHGQTARHLPDDRPPSYAEATGQINFGSVFNNDNHQSNVSTRNNQIAAPINNNG